MAEAGVTEDQLARSDEPEFTDALAAKKEGERHSAEAPAQVRPAEAATLQSSGQDAQGAAGAGMAEMAGARAAVGQRVGAAKGGPRPPTSRPERGAPPR